MDENVILNGAEGCFSICAVKDLREHNHRRDFTVK
jgi:hypothetical protein